MKRSLKQRRRGTVVVIVLWTIALAALTTTATQLLAFRQASFGRIATDRVRARWAARAGLENTISMLAQHTENPEEGDAMLIFRDLELVFYGEMAGATYDIRHSFEGQEWRGPADEHSKLNVNREQRFLALLDEMTPDVVDAVVDWIDDDDNAGLLGVEADYYESLDHAYEPRNSQMRTLAELELVAGIWPDLLRGEDWNLNGRLDPNENDGTRTLPIDKPDNWLDAGWAQHLTTYSIDGGATASGLPRLWLRAAEPAELVERCGVTDAQARSLICYGRNTRNSLEKLLTINLNRVSSTGNVGNQVVNPEAEELTEEQVQAIMDEVSITDPLDRLPGKVNINTITPTLLRELITLGLGADPYVADEILVMRERPEGIVSLMDLKAIPDLQENLWNSLFTIFTTSSSVFTVSSRGRTEGSAVESEMIVVVDRSTLPVKIIEYREQ